MRNIVNRGSAGLKFQVNYQVKMKNGIGNMSSMNHTHILDYYYYLDNTGKSSIGPIIILPSNMNLFLPGHC